MSTSCRTTGATLAILLFLAISFVFAEADAAERRVLVYTRNQLGKGLYVHNNIASASESIRKMGVENNFEVVVSDDPSLFTDDKLKQFKAIVFNNTNNEVLETEEQKSSLQRYVRGGGGVVGIHSATGSMRKWPWFWSLVGGKFVRHPKLQTFTINVKDRADVSTSHLPASFQWEDEFYYVDNMPEGLHVLLAGDLRTLEDPGKAKYPGTKFGDEFPLAWRHNFEGGRSWYTALGHKPEHYADARLAKHILGGILWAMGEAK